jgi:hypothetical protein
MVLIFSSPLLSAANSLVAADFSNGKSKDFRIDKDGDGTLDIWKIKGENSPVVTLKTSPDGSRQLKVSEVSAAGETEAILEENKGAIRITSLISYHNKNVLENKKPVVSSNFDNCKTLVENKLSSFSTDLNKRVLRERADILWANTCEGIPNFDEVRSDLQNTLIDTFKVDGGRKNLLLNCLENSKNKRSTGEVDLWTLEAKSTIADFYNGQLPKGMLSCSRSDKDAIIPTSSGEIRIQVGDLKNFSPPEKLKLSFFNALLLSFGVPSEKVKDISESCLKGDFDRSALLISEAADLPKMHICGKSAECLTDTASVIGTKIASNSELAGINKKLAETKVTIPTAEETSPMALAAIERTQGPEAAQRVARSQSSSLMNAANTVLGAVSSPAVASSRSLASNNASSNRESIKFGESVVGKRLPASAVKARGIASDETIVEEIDLSKRSRNTAAAARTKATISAANSRSPASANGGSNVEATALSDDGGQELGRAGSGAGPSAAGNGGSRGSLLSESSSSVGQQAQARSGSRSGGATASPAREEVVSYFRNADYTQARRKLRDPNFIKILKDNSITVMDLAGNSFGATRGSTIFLDQGDRFVRQK